MLKRSQGVQHHVIEQYNSGSVGICIYVLLSISSNRGEGALRRPMTYDNHPSHPNRIHVKH